MKYCIFLLSIFTLFSCDRMTEETIDDSNSSPFQGIWYGTYAGYLSGNLTITVYKTGALEVVRKDINSSETFQGQILKDGTLSNVTSNSGFYLIGTINNFVSSSGIWKQNSYSGTWEIKKQ
ncbi:hypothetical protein [Epilithonimonas zeae]|uniref:hypothetical protein n=1 Tax=Epilithonimonas zeae TaxID=1416779 RepID=UPI00200BEBB3|nr:hypothetical protein [Epilithonimonas zeae]UQB70163.1 hypothetical protein KI430_06970 [Epilithonimonas zeae]